MDNFEQVRSAKAKRARAPRIEPVAVPIEADIAAVTLVQPAAPEPLEITEVPVSESVAFIDAPEPEQPFVTEPTAADTAEQPQEEPIMATTAETITNTANTAADQGAKMFADVNDRARTAMERGSKLFEEMNGFTKGNVEALVESGRIAVRGFEQMGQEAADYARRSFETASANMRQLTAVKSPTELVRLQADQTRAAFDQAVAETSRSTEAMLKLAGEIVQPISNRFAVVADKMKTAA